MPAFATHYIFLDELKDELIKKADFDFDIKVAGIGCQGPDIFLFHRLWPPFTITKSLNSVSSALHRGKSEKQFEAFKEYLEITDHRDIVKSYIYAYILHYALDRNCHPYVYARQDEFTAENRKMHPLTAHNVIEHAIDTYLLYHRCGIYPPSLFDSKATFSDSEEVYNELGGMISFVIAAALDRNVPVPEAIRAITDTAKTQDTLRDVNGGATRLAHSIEIPLAPVMKNFKFSASIKPKDLELADNCANIKNNPWTSPYDKVERCESFEELFEKSKADALELIDGFEALCRGEKTAYEVTGNISFLTGIEVTD
ncbi:MAG: zinc dependent phospholipase C family protein [Eubacterium sp.]|nr:zinc dependent phospholipase C family protein [Eubacterium sp.]